MIICITGMPGSGKSTVVEMLKKKGFRALDSSNEIYDEMKRRNIPINPENVEKFTKQIKREHGKDFAEKICARKLAKYNGDAAIVGIRHPEGLKTIRNVLGNVPLIAIVAPKRTRYARLSKRKTLATTHKQFEMREERNVRLGVPRTMKFADFIISNSGSRRDLAKALEEALAEIRKRSKD